MNKQDKSKPDPYNMRKKAEKLIQNKPLEQNPIVSESEALRLLHELQVYQIELELQNEELKAAKEAAEVASQKYTDLYDFAPSGYFTLCKEGKIKEINFSGAQMLGNERLSIKNSSFGSYVSDATKPVFNLFLKELFNSKTRETCEVTLTPKDCPSIFVYLTGIITENEIQCVVTAIDISERKYAEQALREVEEHNHDIILHTSMDGFLLFNRFGFLLEVNDTYCRMSGYTMQELLFLRITDLEAAETVESLDSHINNVYLMGETHFETLHRRKDGSIFDVEVSIQSRTADEGQFVAFIHDITDRKTAEKVLFERNEQFRLLFENSSDAILFTNPDGSIYSANPEAERMLGRSIEEIVALERDDISNLNDPRLLPALEERRKTGHFKGELTYRRKNGTIFPVDVTSTIFKDSNGIERSSIIARDITKRKQSDLSLRHSEERYRTLFNSMIEGFCMIEMVFDKNMKPVNYRFLETNAAYEKQSGLADVAGKLMRNIAPETEQYWFDLYGEIALKGELMRFEKEDKTLNKWFEVCAFRMGGEGSIKVAVCFSDITKRKKAEEAIHINNLRLNLAMQAGNMAWWEMDVPTGHVNFNKRKTEMLGYAPEELDNYRDFMALVHPDDQDKCMNSMRAHYLGLTDKYEVEYRILTKSGEYLWCSDIGSITSRDANGNPLSVTGLAFNINVRKRAEEEVLTNNARLTLAMKVSDMAWWEMNIVTGAISFEKRKAEMLGYDPSNFKHYNDFMKLVHPEDAERAMEAMRRHIYGSADKYEVEYRILAKSGEYKWFYDIGSITERDAKGKAILATGLVTNITERKKAEQKIKESEDRRLGILQTAMDGYWLLDMHGKLLEVNETYCRMSGYSKQELLGMHISNLENNETVFDIEARIQIIVALGESRFETCHRRKDGSIFDIEASVQFQPGDGGQLVVFMHDITERKLSELALRESDARVRFKLQSILSPEGNIADLELNDIIDVPTLQKLMNNFYELVQIPIAIIDIKGKVLVGVGWQDICTKFHRVHSQSCQNCIESDVYLTEGIPDGEFKLYKCKNNMWDMATPLIIGGEHKGNLFLGQFFFDSEPLDYQLFREQVEQYGFDEKEYIEALEKVPHLNSQKLDHAKAFFLNLARSISQLSYSNIKLARAITQQKQVENALRENEELLKKAQEIAHLGSFSLDLITNRLIWSDEIYRIFGLQPKELSSTYEGFLDAIHPDDREAVNSAYTNSIAEDKDSYEIEHRIIRKCSGEIRYVFEKCEHIRDASGKIVSSVGMIHDITNRKQSEIAIIENERLLRESQAAAHIGSYSADLINKSWKASPEIFKIFGIDDTYSNTLDAWVGAIHADFRQELSSDLYQIKEGVKHFEHEYKIIRINDNVERWIYGYGEFEYDKTLTPFRLVGTIQDITERKIKEKALHKLNHTLTALGKSSQAMAQAVVESDYLKQVCKIIVEDTEFAMVWIGFAQDDEAKTILPMASAGLCEDYLQSINLSWADTDIGHGPTGTAIRTGKMCMCNNMLTDSNFAPWREQALKRGYVSSIVFPLKTGDHTFGAITIYSKEPNSFLDDEINLLHELSNDLAYGITTIRLRTSHKLAEIALNQSHNELEVLVIKRTKELQITNDLLKKEINNVKLKKQSLVLAEEKYRTVADYTHGWEFWLDKDDNFLYCSPSCERITGYKASEFIQNPALLLDIIHPDDLIRFRTHKNTEDLCLVVNHELEYRIIRKDGIIRWIGHECQPITDEAGNFMGIRGSNKDITARKEIEQLLKINNQKYRLLSENITDGIFICKNGSFEYVNKAMNHIFGYADYKMDRLMITSLALPEYHKELNKILNISSTVNKLQTIEIECLKKDHSTIYVEILFNYVAKEELLYGVVHDITDRKLLQKNIVKAIIQTEEKERANFSKELHDGLGPLLSTIKLYLQWSERPKTNTSREEIIHKAEDILEEALTTVKEISNKLSPHLLNYYGLTSAIQSFVDKLLESSEINIVFESNSNRRLGNEIEAALYRVIIECINNTIKYAGASTINIDLNDTDTQLIMRYRDDGKGFDLENVLSIKKGLGLFNLQSRIQTIGGKINLFSEPGKGVDYQISVNL